jgi:hypothetical protein
MRIGIISDTHDDMQAIETAVAIFNSEKVSHVIHAGDITSPFTFEIFKQLSCNFTGIFGNNDGDKLLLRDKAEGNLHNQPLNLIMHNKKIVVMHEPDIVHALSESGHYDIVIYGHTHRPDITIIKNTLVVNPGKAARLQRGGSTIALADLETMEAKIINLYPGFNPGSP